MTTSGAAGKPARRHAAGLQAPPGTGDHAEDAPDDGAPPATRQADAETRSPDDVQALQQEIEQTREQLGETVEQLVAKADVKARARDKAAELTSQVKGKASEIKGKASQAQAQAAGRLGKVREQLASKTEGTGQRATSLGAAAKDRLSSGVAAVTTPVREAAPEPVRRAVSKGASSARQCRAPLAVAVSVLVVGYLAIRWRRRR